MQTRLHKMESTENAGPVNWRADIVQETAGPVSPNSSPATCYCAHWRHCRISVFAHRKNFERDRYLQTKTPKPISLISVGAPKVSNKMILKAITFCGEIKAVQKHPYRSLR